jgi:hypothetical protein
MTRYGIWAHGRPVPILLAAFDYDYPDSRHHPKDDLREALRCADSAAAATIGDLEAEYQDGANRILPPSALPRAPTDTPERLAYPELAILALLGTISAGAPKHRPAG